MQVPQQQQQTQCAKKYAKNPDTRVLLRIQTSLATDVGHTGKRERCRMSGHHKEKSQVPAPSPSQVRGLRRAVHKGPRRLRRQIVHWRLPPAPTATPSPKRRISVIVVAFACKPGRPSRGYPHSCTNNHTVGERVSEGCTRAFTEKKKKITRDGFCVERVQCAGYLLWHKTNLPLLFHEHG